MNLQRLKKEEVDFHSALWNILLKIVEESSNDINYLVVLCGTGFMQEKPTIVGFFNNLESLNLDVKGKHIELLSYPESFAIELMFKVRGRKMIRFMYNENYDDNSLYMEKLNLGEKVFLPKRSFYPLILKEFTKELIDLYV